MKETVYRKAFSIKFTQNISHKKKSKLSKNNCLSLFSLKSLELFKGEDFHIVVIFDYFDFCACPNFESCKLPSGTKASLVFDF